MDESREHLHAIANTVDALNKAMRKVPPHRRVDVVKKHVDRTVRMAMWRAKLAHAPQPTTSVRENKAGHITIQVKTRHPRIIEALKALGIPRTLTITLDS